MKMKIGESLLKEIRTKTFRFILKNTNNYSSSYYYSSLLNIIITLKSRAKIAIFWKEPWANIAFRRLARF